MRATQAPPRWDMTPIFPSLDSPEFAESFASAVREIEALKALFDECDVRRLDASPPVALAAARMERVLVAYNGVLDHVRTVRAYVHAFVSVDSRDEVAKARASEFQLRTLALAQLGARFTAWAGSLDVEGLIAASPVAADHTFLLRKASERAQHLMEPADEALAIELNVTGGSAWSRLHGAVTSQLSVPIALNDEARELPMSMVRSLAYEHDRDLRRHAYEAELAGWKRVATPLVAALNSIKGEVNTLTHRRGWETPLDAALLDANIDQPTLDAMFAAAHEAFPDFRRYLRAKAGALGLD
ncbi:MAG: M3 family oligoendopeptidase, partial [Ktedonobacterales bacterium]